VRPLPEGPADHVVLVGADSLEGYRAELVLRDGTRACVLARAEPAGVLTDALSLSAALGVPLEAGWGLDEAAIDLLRAPRERVGPPAEGRVPESHRPVLDQRIGAFTALWAAFFIPAATVVLALSPARPDLPPSTLALVLPALTALIALGIGLVLLGLHRTVTLTDGKLRTQRFWFKVRLGAEWTDPGRVVGAFSVAAGVTGPEHLLVATADGLTALPTGRQAGRMFPLYSGGAVGTAGRAAE
jgi:hypothetical protein